MIIIRKPITNIFNVIVPSIQKPGQNQEQTNIGIFHCYSLHFEKMVLWDSISCKNTLEFVISHFIGAAIYEVNLEFEINSRLVTLVVKLKLIGKENIYREPIDMNEEFNVILTLIRNVILEGPTTDPIHSIAYNDYIERVL